MTRGHLLIAAPTGAKGLAAVLEAEMDLLKLRVFFAPFSDSAYQKETPLVTGGFRDS